MKQQSKIAVLALALLGASGAANATLMTQARCGTPNPNVQALEIGTTASSCALSADYNHYGYIFSGSGAASSTAQYGVLKAVTSSSSSPSQGNHSSAFAGFADTITVNAAGMQGKRGVLTVGFVHHWDAYQWHDSTGWSSVDTTLSAFASNIAGGGANHSFRAYRSDTSTGAPVYTSYNNGAYVDHGALFVMDIPFYFGSAFTLDLSLYAAAGGGANGVFSGSFHSIMNAGNSGYWDGVKSIVSDEPLTSPWSLSSGSGTDYNRSFVPVAAPVPEPVTLSLFAVGLAALGARRRRSAR